MKETRKISVNLNPDAEMTIYGTPYFWVILQFNEVWHNISCGWAVTPLEAFTKAQEWLERYDHTI